MAKAMPDQKAGEAATAAANPLEFHVYGPRNLPCTNWRDLLNSSWKNPSYRRMVIACFIQGAYLLELDRQEKRDERTGLASQWWRPFKYRLLQPLVDERDGSMYGAVLEWDHQAALSDYIPFRPTRAPAAVVALRGTLLRAPTFRRDVVDDLRCLAWDSLKGSVRFPGALAALRDVARRFGAGNVCVGGHSLGAGFALQVGKALAKEGVNVECHVFNPPSVSLAMSLRVLGETAGELWGRARAWIPFVGSQPAPDTSGGNSESEAMASLAQAGMARWIPYLYINTNDYICCHYTSDAAGGTAAVAVDNRGRAGNGTGKAGVATMVMVSKGPTKFLAAHGLEQWWADDVELQVVLNDSKLIGRQLRSLYAAQVAGR
ncbi:GDSL esterase/lipase At4g10955 [Lolium perenne]|uniref:GDSL esterase/lipase At4g10955 n=1 Tax=Lolium perenne TaxID=4522 RepID=UPI0021F637A1|nr:GDSL esterase/lipase At4g10955-like [Lolium perenne]XP_051225316.1 GDSL esterase/lipase At4g10955-like [Lolium perenne]